MQTEALSGGFADPPRGAALAFRAALEAMARPGTIHRIAGAAPPAPLSPAAGALLLTLTDPGTAIVLAGDRDSAEIRDWIAFQTGAPTNAAPGAATVGLGPFPALLPLDQWPMGTPDYPDRSATLIVEMDTLVADGARLTGPGIATEARLGLPGDLRSGMARFPLGLDIFLCAGDRLAAIPRSTRIEPA